MRGLIGLVVLLGSIALALGVLSGRVKLPSAPARSAGGGTRGEQGGPPDGRSTGGTQ